MGRYASAYHGTRSDHRMIADPDIPDDHAIGTHLDVVLQNGAGTVGAGVPDRGVLAERDIIPDHGGRIHDESLAVEQNKTPPNEGAVGYVDPQYPLKDELVKITYGETHKKQDAVSCKGVAETKCTYEEGRFGVALQYKEFAKRS